jgi:5'-nucleotidase
MNSSTGQPCILVSNDDGIYAPGLQSLAAALRQIGRAVIIAPEQNNSAVSHSLTMHKPLRVKKMDHDTYSINGTPTDCVTLGIGKILPEKPALVVSGINPGANLGDDVSYSGTVSAAIEGTMHGVPSVAVSLAGEAPFNFTPAAAIAAALCRLVLARGLPADTLLNVNIPNSSMEEITSIRFTRQGRRTYDDAIKETFDPWGKKHYWIGGGRPTWDGGEDTDSSVIEMGGISITPIHLDLTNYDALDLLQKKWRDTDLMDRFPARKKF